VQKAEGLTLYARADYNENLIAESEKIEITQSNVPDINFSFSLNVSTSDANSLEEIAYKPIISELLSLYISLNLFHSLLLHL
jgi:hypothetical protein